MHVFSGLLIGRSAPLPTSTDGVRGYDPRVGRRTVGGGGATILPKEACGQINWEPWNHLKMQGEATPIRGNNSRLHVAGQGNDSRFDIGGGKSTPNQLLTSRVKRFYNRGRRNLTDGSPWVKSTLASDVASRCKGRQLWSRGQLPTTVEPDLIVTEMLAFPPKPSKNKNDCNLMRAIP